VKQKENIFEELNKMRSLIHTKPGVVISEQSVVGAPQFGMTAGQYAMSADNDKSKQRLQNLANIQRTVDAQGIIKNPASQFNNTRWADYIAKFDIKQDEINQAKELTKTQKATADNTQKRIQNIANIARMVNADGMIVNPSSQFNNTPWADYISKFKITQDEIGKANELNKKVAPAQSGNRQSGNRSGGGNSQVVSDYTKQVQTSLGLSPTGKISSQELDLILKNLNGEEVSGELEQELPKDANGKPDFDKILASL
jgi:hypothetical protein